MEHGFPPSVSLSTISTEMVVAHVTMLLLVFGSVGGLFLTRKRSASSTDIWIWAALILAAPLGAVITHQTLNRFGKDAAGPFLYGYVFFVWMISFVGMVRCHRSLKTQQKSSPMGCSISCLIALGLLIMFLLPAVPQAREAARRSQCKSHLKQIGIALLNHLDEHGSFPHASVGNPTVSWRVQILPHFDQQKLFEKYDQKSPWDSEVNDPIARIQVSGMSCPSRRNPPNGVSDNGRFFTDYTMLTGPGTFSGNFEPRNPAGIKDGASNTLAVVEAAGLNIIWTEPRDANVDREPLGINFKGKGEFDSPGLMSAWHLGGAQATFADGSVRFISQDIDPAVLKALTTVDGGEQLPQSY
ncbi:MAG: prepilin-type processing-associated H-X9-DG protein [Planctomycetaceae bacterium]|jgi:prepilin-type processing-associated H-X9-DG protein